MAYAYQATLYCDECAEKIMSDLKRPDYEPPWDTDDYPQRCMDGEETDSPSNCDSCHRPLDELSLTSDGVEYVLEHIRESIGQALERGRAEYWDKVERCYDGTYYEGMRHVEIVRDWAEKIRGYGLDPEEQALVDLFLEFSEAESDGKGGGDGEPSLSAWCDQSNQ